MEIHIYHASPAIFGGAMFASDKSQYVQSQFAYYDKIATVHIKQEGLSINAMLDQAFRDTNSIDTNWFEGSNVTLENDNIKHRSTSVGDVFEINSLKYIVDSFGFLPMEDVAQHQTLFVQDDDLFQEDGISPKI